MIQKRSIRIKREIVENVRNLFFLQKAKDPNFHCIFLGNYSQLVKLTSHIMRNISEYRSKDFDTYILLCTSYNMEFAKIIISSQCIDIQVMLPTLYSLQHNKEVTYKATPEKSDIHNLLKDLPAKKTFYRISEFSAKTEMKIFASVLRVFYNSLHSQKLLHPNFVQLIGSNYKITINDIYNVLNRDEITRDSSELCYNQDELHLSEIVR